MLTRQQKNMLMTILAVVGKKLTNVGTPTSNADAATKKYVDDNSGGGTYSNLRIDSNIDMKDTYCILNLKSPSDGDQPATKQYADIKITTATKIYTDNLVNTTVSNYLKRDGTNAMTGDLNTGGHKIINL